jgi:hypothetical protein
VLGPCMRLVSKRRLGRIAVALLAVCLLEAGHIALSPPDRSLASLPFQILGIHAQPAVSSPGAMPLHPATTGCVTTNSSQHSQSNSNWTNSGRQLTKTLNVLTAFSNIASADGSVRECFDGRTLTSRIQLANVKYKHRGSGGLVYATAGDSSTGHPECAEPCSTWLFPIKVSTLIRRGSNVSASYNVSDVEPANAPFVLNYDLYLESIAGTSPSRLQMSFVLVTDGIQAIPNVDNVYSVLLPFGNYGSPAIFHSPMILNGKASLLILTPSMFPVTTWTCSRPQKV